MNNNIFIPQPDDSEHVAQAVNVIGTVMNTLDVKWFVSFGALLYFIRDKNMGIPFDQDFDISVLGDINREQLAQRFSEFGFPLKNKYPKKGKPYQMVFKHHDILLSIDVFMWVEANGHWWHTYDQGSSKFVWKGTPERMFRGDTYSYPWVDIVPDLRFPNLYGTLLDYWYPGWYVPDKQFGQSQGKIVKLGDLKNLGEKLK